jgi:hypothetical protein
VRLGLADPNQVYEEKPKKIEPELVFDKMTEKEIKGLKKADLFKYATWLQDQKTETEKIAAEVS